MAVLVWPPLLEVRNHREHPKSISWMETEINSTFFHLPFRPLAPLAACRASRRSTLRSGLEESRSYAMLAPLTPDPTITISAATGKSGVVRQSAISSGGSCQYDFVGSSLGRPGGILRLCSILGCEKSALGAIREDRYRLLQSENALRES